MRILFFSIFIFFSLGSFAKGSDALVKVNGVVINNQAVEDVVKSLTQNGRQKDTPELRQSILNQMVDQEVLVQQAYKSGLDKTPDFNKGVERFKRNYLIQSLFQDYLKKNPIADADLKAEYDAQVDYVIKNPVKEYRLYSILLASESDALAVIAKLKDNESFEKLAKEKSIGPTKQSGGLVGWVRADGVLPALGAALPSVPKGAYSVKPIRSRMGWHVIKIEDIRPYKMPAFEEVKDQIAGVSVAKKRQFYLKKLTDSAKIER